MEITITNTKSNNKAMSDMNIAEVSINEVRPYWRNPRKNDETVDALKDSISKYGYTVPIVVDQDGIILAGHARYRALVQLGYEKVRIVQVELDEEKARQFRIADNKAGEFTEWDIDTLEKELEDLGAGSMENISGFFQSEEWSDIMDVSSFNTAQDDSENEDGPLDEQVPPSGSTQVSDTLDGNQEQGRVIELLCPHCLEENTFTQEEFRVIVDKARAVAKADE